MNKCQRQGFQKIFTVTAMPVVDTSLSSVYVWIARGSQDTSIDIDHWANPPTRENRSTVGTCPRSHVHSDVRPMSLKRR